MAPGAEAASPSKISVEGLNFYYGSTRALQDISLEILDRRVTAIIGPSGCGKSTLIKSINRIAELADNVRIDGDVRLDGRSIFGKSVDLVDLRRRVGMVFQKPNPFPKSIYDNVAFGPRLHGLGKKSDLDEIVEQALTQAALWKEVKDRLAQSALELSGGQQQRLCIARALATEPEVLLLDEPTASLDPISSQKVEELVYELRRDMAVVIVTHNMQQAARVSDVTAFFLLGELVEVAPTKTIFTTPKDPRTEAYVTGRFG